MGLTFEANDADLARAEDFSKRCKSRFVEYVEKRSLKHEKYPAVNRESCFLEITWSQLPPDGFEPAQFDFAFIGSQVLRGSRKPAILVVERIYEICEQYELALDIDEGNLSCGDWGTDFDGE